MRALRSTRQRLLAASALAAAGALAAFPAAADNVIRLNTTGTASTVAITQDATNNSNSISNGSGGQLSFGGRFASITINQQGGDNVLSSTGITRSGASTTSAVSLLYGSAGAGGDNQHTLNIGGTTQPNQVDVTVNVLNTDPGVTQNVITDSFDGTSLAYTLDINGTDNTVSNTIASGAAVSADIDLVGDGNSVTNALAATGAITLDIDLAGSDNTVSNTVSSATSASITLSGTGSGNTITNNSTTSGAKTIAISLGSASNSTVDNTFTGAGNQTSNLTVTGTSILNFDLASAAAGTTSSITLNNVVGVGGNTAANVNVSQTAAATGASIALTVDGGSFAAGVGGVQITQASANAVLNATHTAAASGWTYSISQ